MRLGSSDDMEGSIDVGLLVCSGYTSDGLEGGNDAALLHLCVLFAQLDTSSSVNCTDGPVAGCSEAVPLEF